MFILTSAPGAVNGFVQFIVAVLLFVVVLALAYYTTKWLGGYQKKYGSNKNFRIVETIKVSQNKFLEIIEAGRGRYFIIGIGKDEVTLIGELSPDEVIEGSAARNAAIDPEPSDGTGTNDAGAATSGMKGFPSPGAKASFSDFLSAFKNRLPAKKTDEDS